MIEQTKKFSEWIPALQGIAAYVSASFVNAPGKELEILEIMILTNPVVTFGFEGGSPRYARIEKDQSEPFQMALDALLIDLQVKQLEKEGGK